MLGVGDRAELGWSSRYRANRCCLPRSSSGSALRSGSWISRLSTRPTRTPVNASCAQLPVLVTHDSGPLWVAIPSTS